jgi:hypothetical protein
MKIHPIAIKKADTLYKIDTLSEPWRIVKYRVLRVMPGYLDIESINTKNQSVIRIRRDLKIGTGIRYIQEFFLSVDDLLCTHRIRAQRRISLAKRQIDNANSALENLDALSNLYNTPRRGGQSPAEENLKC